LTVYVDSNYWVYWMDSRHPEHRHVSRSMKAAIREGILLNFMNLLEIAHYFRGLGESELLSRMDKLRNLTTLTLTELDSATTDEALRILGRYSSAGIGGRDAVVLATMRLHGVKRILTHDKDFKRVKGIKVVDSIPEQP
jgi:predicted nucleic acid-binding protein